MPGKALIVLLLMCAAAAPITAQTPGFLQTPESLDADGFQEVLFKVAPNVYLSGQPSEAGFTRARKLGVTRVINLRTGMEMDSREVVPFDEAQLLAGLGLDYVHVPSGGPNTPYAPFAQALAVGRQLNFGTFPLEGFIDAPLTVTPLQTRQGKDNNE